MQFVIIVAGRAPYDPVSRLIILRGISASVRLMRP